MKISTAVRSASQHRFVHQIGQQNDGPISMDDQKVRLSDAVHGDALAGNPDAKHPRKTPNKIS